MIPFVVMAVLFIPLFAQALWFEWRLRSAAAERHRSASAIIDSTTRRLPRRERLAYRLRRYRELQDAEMDWHIHRLERTQRLYAYIWLGFVAVMVSLIAITSATR